MIPRSMPKHAITTEIECANIGKINGFSRLPMALITPFDLNILTHVPNFYVAPSKILMVIL